MAKRKSKRSSRRRSKVKAAVRDMPAVWKSLVIFNLLITTFGFWMMYSQNNYIMNAIERSFPVALPADYKGTSIVISPLTGQFVAINPVVSVGTLLGVLAIIGVYFILKENL